ncbi:myocardin related transcription factor Ab isoform X3 [Colossoma macropomum]|uniref:myocardin related transcription factor Ab isoform X3 n=1 Tax=Colossoma macropomum TaxID=42526 RepID=UPI00186457B3|nr:myocardin related transcription factor Ab isoform X3 [Colossoma macropomum]
MLDTNHCLHVDASSFEDQPTRTDRDKQPVRLDYDRHAYHSLKEVLQLKLQQRRTREELVNQGIMPPLKSPAAFHEQRKSLERARTEDYLKRKIRSRPERSELVRMHILEETSAEPSLQAKQLKLKRARLADDLNDKISHRPGPIELIHKNILPVPTLIGSPKGENSSLDEDSSDALSPDQPGSQDSPLGHTLQHSPSDMLNLNRNPSPTQFLTQAPASLLHTTDSSSSQNMTSGTLVAASARPPTGPAKPQSKSSSDRPTQRSKKPKENKPKVKKLKYHQYIPPDQKNDREPPPQLDSSYAKILHQQQLFLQLQIISQQQQHYNYHTILPAPPKLPAEQQQQQPPANTGPSPSRSVSTPSATPSTQNGSNRQNQPPAGGAKPGVLPANLDEFKVAELKQELKLRGLTVSGTKNDLIERLKNYQEQNGGAGPSTGTGPVKTVPATSQQVAAQSCVSAPQQSKDVAEKVAAFPLITTNGVHTAAPPQIMRFSSTSSSPPVSPTPSDRSLAGMSADETSCNGDVFGEMVSSPLTQLTLHPSPEHPSPIKEEPLGLLQSSCCFSRPTPVPPLLPQPQEPSLAAPLGPAALVVDKDQMLQEKDKQIEELTRMLRQKQQLVETLRSQLEQGKRGAGTEGTDNATKTERAALPNGEAVKVKEEAKEDMETLAEPQPQAQPQRKTQTQCSQQTLLKLQQIHRLQVQQQQQQQMQVEQTKLQQQPKSQLLQQQRLQQLIIQQSQQKQKQLQANQKKQQRPQKQQQHKERPLQTQQISQVFINQQTGTQVTTSFPLDLLKAHPAPTLVTDGNGNHYLIALANNSVDSLNGESSLNKTNGRITLQRLQSTPVKLPSQSTHEVANSINQSQQPQQPQQAAPVKQPSPKVQKAALHLETPVVQQSSHPVSAPPNLQPFFLSEEPNPITQPSSPPSLKENGSNNQHIDDLFDILVKSGEISAGFKANPDPSLSDLHSNPPTPSPPSSPLHLSPPTPPSDPVRPSDTHERPCSGTGRLEDFLESTTGTPLLGVELDGPLTLIDDLHNQMLSTPSILDHPPSPMDTGDLSFSPHPTSLDFEDPALDGMDWLDISMGGSSAGGGTVLAPLGSHTPPSVFSADFLDSSDLQIHWDSCL